MPFASSLSKVPTFKVANTPSPSPPLYHSNSPILLGWRTPTPPSSGIYTETFASPKPPASLSVDMSRSETPEPMAEVADRNTAGGRCTRAMENNLTHTHTTLTHTSGAVDTEEALDARGNAKGKDRKSVV